MAQIRCSSSEDLESYAPVMVEDLVSGLQDWRQVPDIVRLTFKAIVDLLTTQGSAIADIERQLPTKASKSDLSAGLSTKANLSDVTQSLLETNTALQKSITPEVLNSALKDKISRSEFLSLPTPDTHLSLLEQQISHFHSQFEPIHSAISDLNDTYDLHIQRLNQQVKELWEAMDQKAEVSEVEVMVGNKADKQSVASALQRKVNREEMEELGQLKNNVDCLISDLSTLRSTLEANFHQFHDKLSTSNQETSTKILTFDRKIHVIEKDLHINSKQISKLTLQIEGKMNNEQLNSVFSAFKYEINDLISVLKRDFGILDEKIVRKYEKLHGFYMEMSKNVANIQGISQEAKDLHRNVLDLIEDLNIKKADSQDLIELYRNFTEKKQEKDGIKLEMEKYREILILLQAEIKRLEAEICVIPGIRSEIQSCVRSLDLLALLESKASVVDLHQVRDSVVRLHGGMEVLMMENCTARWLWRSGGLEAGQKVPWEVECVNTQPENFLWEQGATEICMVSPGLYDLRIGVYTRIKPKAMVMVNDQVLYRLGTEPGTEKLWTPHMDGNLIGLTLNDVIAMPARARISVVYEGECRAEAFICLRKL